LEQNKQRIVVKVGTSTLTHNSGALDLWSMEHLVRTLADLQGMGHEVILVSSGAIAVGTAKLGLSERPKELRMKQAAAAVGQCRMMHIYDKFFSEYNRSMAQILLTGDDVEDPERAGGRAGLAPDGGLFVPERIPQADMAVAERLAGESYAALAGYLAELFFGDDIDPGLLRREMERIYDFPLPLRRVGSRYTLELFHGPTFAFKDYGAGFMGRMIGLMGGAGEKLVILTATSGDTGSAVAHGFYGVPGVEVVLLYPEGKISRLQECQMTTLGGNIHPLRVAGTFDDCQRLVKGLFADAKFRAGHRVSSANSINLLRWIPQAFYYFYGYCLWRQQTGGRRAGAGGPGGD